MQSFRYTHNVHACMMVMFIIGKHSGDILNGETHVNIKIGSYIPGTVIPMICIRSDSLLQIFDIIDTRQNNGLEGRCISIFSTSRKKAFVKAAENAYSLRKLAELIL